MEKVELNIQLDPRLQALYSQAKLVLRNHSDTSTDTLELEFPAPVAEHVQVRAVWDRGGALPWRFDPAEADASGALLVALRSPWGGGKKLELVVGYDLKLENFTSSEAAVAISADSARLSTTGWYPVPADSDPAIPRSLQLTVRLPKEWQVEAPGRIKRLRDGTALATYEFRLEHVEPGQLLLRAGTTLPP